MHDQDDRLKAFESRLANLKHKMERGLLARAEQLRTLARAVERGDDAARREIKSESHKLRGIAGTYGHERLTALAGALEQKASISPAPAVARLTRDLADAAERAGKASVPPPPLASAPPSERPEMSSIERTISMRPNTTSEDGEPLRVLAMDDDPETLQLLTMTLKTVGGFNATIVDSANEALKLLDSERFDVVVSDAMMPEMNAQEFCAAAREAGATMPIIVLSAASRSELGWPDEHIGPSAWLRKPFKPAALVHDIARIVEEGREPIA